MSLAPILGVHRPKHWQYMACVMERELGAMIESRIPRRMPEGVRLAAVEFLELAIEAVDHEMPENPPASLNALMIAWDALKGSLEREVVAQERDRLLHTVLATVRGIPHLGRRISRRVRKDMQISRQFFASFHAMGIAEGPDVCAFPHH